MNNFIKKSIVLTIFIVLSISIIVPIMSFAAEGGQSASYKTQMNQLVTSQDSWTDKSTASEKVNNIMSAISVIVRIAGMCVAVTLLLVIAMKYMMAAPGEKADIKRASTAYVIGALILFGAVGILQIIANFSENISSTTTPAAGGDTPS